MLVATLLLSSAVAVLWVRSYAIGDEITRVGTVGSDMVESTLTVSYGGAVICNRRDIGGAVFLDRAPQWYWRSWSASTCPSGYVGVTVWKGAGFEFVRASIGRWKFVSVVAPFWFLMLMTGTIPAIAALRYVRRRRREGRGFAVVVSEDRAGGGEGSRKSG